MDAKINETEKHRLSTTGNTKYSRIPYPSLFPLTERVGIAEGNKAAPQIGNMKSTCIALV